MIKLRYIVAAISIIVAMSFLAASCQLKAQEPAPLKDLSISVVATQMKVLEPPPPPSPPPAPAPPTPAPPSKPGAAPTAAPPGKPGATPTAAPPAKPGAPGPASPPPPAPAAPPAKPAGPPPGPPPTISLTFTFKIDNPNDVDMRLQQLHYSVSGAGLSIPIKMGQLFTVDSKIPAKGSILREDTVEVIRAGPYAAMWELIKQVDRWTINGVALIVQEGFSQPFSSSK